jgi:Ca2+-binding EF-hand superfamily protein
LFPDNSGELNMEELDDAFRKMGIELTTSELKDLVEEVDADGNGLIDKGEFCDMVLTTVSFLMAVLSTRPR